MNGSVIKDQKQVAEVLVEHCATLADGIGGDAAECKALEDFKDHSCVRELGGTIPIYWQGTLRNTRR